MKAVRRQPDPQLLFQIYCMTKSSAKALAYSHVFDVFAGLSAVVAVYLAFWSSLKIYETVMR